MCEDHWRLEEMVTPRYLYCVTSSRSSPFSFRVGQCFVYLTVMHLHFETLKTMRLFRDHREILLMSCCRSR